MSIIFQDASVSVTKGEIMVTPTFLVGVETQAEFLAKLQAIEGIPQDRYHIKATDESETGKVVAIWDNEQVQRFTPMITKCGDGVAQHVENCVIIINTK